jgi:SAM-dependent methyltransferase
MGMEGEGLGMAGEACDQNLRVQELIDKFLIGRKNGTLQAYTIDLNDFARFLSTTPAAAVARLLAGVPSAASHLVLKYGMDLRRRGRAPATLDRRLNTLRALVREANRQGLVEWQLRLPTADDISTAMESLPANDSEHYLLPRHLGEIDRMDVAHYAIRQLLRANYLAPVKDPARVLDVGSGTGQWGFEVCHRFDRALVVGFDLVSGKPEQPPRYRYVRGNVLHGLPFKADRFDFVHQRSLAFGVPLASWPAVVSDLSRVARPGGWVELVEGPWACERAGPAAERIMELSRPLLASLGLDTTDVVYRSVDRYLSQAGLTNVERRQIEVSIGRWGGAVGSLMVTSIRAATTRVCEVLQARGMLSAESTWELIREARGEWEDGRMAYPVAVAFGQKTA